MGLLALLLSLSACQQEGAEVPEPANAIYHWRSQLTLSARERAFLRDQQIGKVYLHLFDVVRRNGQLRPDATVSIIDTLPDNIHVIPIVFLAPNVLQDTTGLSALPQLIARRVTEMMVQNGLPRPDELQIDFDWTKRNQSRYYSLLSSLRHAFEAEGGHRLSATIRLHQLSMKAPPVDYGALMVYNVGNYASYDERCSILTPERVKPYLRHLPDYPLPLCTALPIYSWDLLFHDHEFECILRGVNLQDTTNFEPLDATHYRSTAYLPIPPAGVTTNGRGRILPFDVVRHEQVSAAMLDSVRSMLHESRPSAVGQVILYHLDEKQINQYSNEELKALYTGH